MKVLITGGGSGGHVSPALAVAQRLRREFADTDILYVGGNMTMEGSTGASLEAQLVGPTGIPLKIIHVGKLKRGRISLSTLTRLWGVVPGFFEAWRIVGQFKPDVIFSSGGYVSLPVVVAGWLRRRPVVVHEQTAAVGLANSIAGRLAKKVAITFPQSARYFDERKVVLTGNPMQPDVIEPNLEEMRKTDLGRWISQSPKPVVYVTGGGLGSHIINMTVAEALPHLLQLCRLVHQCGAHAGFNDFDRLDGLRREKGLQNDYWVAKHFSAQQVGLLYASIGGVVARAGANTVLELAAWGLPCVFIPIPWVTHDEQTKNAQVLVDAGTAAILPEKELTPERLTEAIEQMLRRGPDVQAKEKAQKVVDRQAAEKLTDLVVEVGSR